MNKSERLHKNRIIREIPRSDGFEILGHRIDNYNSLWDAVEVSSSTGDANEDYNGNLVVINKPYISTEDNPQIIPGLHILIVYQRFPCFDSYDYAYENRYYRSFFFSDKPFTEEEITRYACIKNPFIPENVPDWALPIVCCHGDSDTMTLATKKSK